MQGLTEAVAEDGISVLVSSHVVADLERVCDYLIIITAGRIQVAGDVDRLLDSHHLLVGPRLPGGAGPPGVAVVKASHTERQSSLWVRGRIAHMPDGCREEPVSLEELVITYLSVPS